MSAHGVLNLLKPPGMTSHDAVAFVRRVLKEKRVGHTGTLDPAAAGVLPICVGQATRLVETLQGGTKEYIAEASFGVETDSGDVLGKVVREGDRPTLSLDEFRGALDKFRGTISQVPPMHSAIKVDGKKLYDIARAGGEVEIPVREVKISRLVVLNYRMDLSGTVTMLIECSGGTYIRSLIRDIGREIGSAATMSFLMRTRVGGFYEREAVSIEDFARHQTLIPFEEAATWCAPDVITDDEATAALAQGKRVQVAASGKAHLTEYREDSDASKVRRTKVWQHEVPENTILVRNSAGSVFVLAHRTSDGAVQPDKVFNLNA